MFLFISAQKNQTLLNLPVDAKLPLLYSISIEADIAG